MSRTFTDTGDGTEPFTFSENRIQVRHDIDSEGELGTTLTNAIALLTDNSEEAVGTKLAATVDFDALDRLFQPQSNTSRAGGRVVLTVCDCSVTVTSTGLVIIERRVE